MGSFSTHHLKSNTVCVYVWNVKSIKAGSSVDCYVVRAHPGTVIVKQVFVEWMSKYIKKKKKGMFAFP